MYAVPPAQSCTKIQLANVSHIVRGQLATTDILVVLAIIHLRVPGCIADRYCGGTFYPPTHHGTSRGKITNLKKCKKFFKEHTSAISISQLLADHSSISVVPGVITHCPPLVIDAHLHSTLILTGASHQTNISIGTVANGIDYIFIMNTYVKVIAAYNRLTHLILTLASHSCTYIWIPIPPRPAITADKGTPWAVSKFTFTATASYFIQVNCSSTSTKASIGEGHCICWCNQTS